MIMFTGEIYPHIYIIDDSIWADAPSDDANDNPKKTKLKKCASNEPGSTNLQSRKPEPQKVQMLAKANSEEVWNAESSGRKPRTRKELPPDYVYKGISDSQYVDSEDNGQVVPTNAEFKKLEARKPEMKKISMPIKVNSPEITAAESGIRKPRERKGLPADYIYKGIDDSQWADAPDDTKSELKKIQPKKLEVPGKTNRGEGRKAKDNAKDIKGNVLNNRTAAEANRFEVIGKMGPYDVQRMVGNANISGLSNGKLNGASGLAKKHVKSFEVVCRLGNHDVVRPVQADTTPSESVQKVAITGNSSTVKANGNTKARATASIIGDMTGATVTQFKAQLTAIKSQATPTSHRATKPSNGAMDSQKAKTKPMEVRSKAPGQGIASSRWDD